MNKWGHNKIAAIQLHLSVCQSNASAELISGGVSLHQSKYISMEFYDNWTGDDKSNALKRITYNTEHSVFFI